MSRIFLSLRQTGKETERVTRKILGTSLSFLAPWPPHLEFGGPTPSFQMGPGMRCIWLRAWPQRVSVSLVPSSPHPPVEQIAQRQASWRWGEGFGWTLMWPGRSRNILLKKHYLISRIDHLGCGKTSTKQLQEILRPMRWGWR